MDSMEKYAGKIEYRLICIIGRESGIGEIAESIKKIERLSRDNKRFADTFAGIDLAGNESAQSPAELRTAVMPFLENCVHVTNHAGETE
jgi:adenosine deaminase